MACEAGGDMFETLMGVLLLIPLAVYIVLCVVAEVLRSALEAAMHSAAWLDRRLGTDHMWRRVRMMRGSWVKRLLRWMGRDHG